MGLKGHEATYLKKITEGFNVSPTDKHVFYNGTHQLATFDNDKSPQERTEYEFEINVPEWLPPTTIHNSEYAIYMRTKYEVWAQVMPLNDQDSSVQGYKMHKEVYIYNEVKPIP